MPNRIIREGMLESEVIDKLSAHAERFFFRLMLRADDYGRYHAHPQILRSHLFPLKSDVRSTEIGQWLTECEAVALIRLYECDGKRFIEIPKFNQRIRSDSKFPRPPWGDSHLVDTRQTDDSGSPPYSESEAESKANSETESKATVGVEGGLSALGNRISAWFKRRPTTQWSAKEIKALRVVEKLNTPEPDIALLQGYYTAIILPPARDIRRRDICTLLNNWPGEIDRARRWKEESTTTKQTDFSKGF